MMKGLMLAAVVVILSGCEDSPVAPTRYGTCHYPFSLETLERVTESVCEDTGGTWAPDA